MYAFVEVAMSEDSVRSEGMFSLVNGGMEMDTHTLQLIINALTDN